MAIFPQRYFTEDNAVIHTGPLGARASWKSHELARKFAGPPKGVYQGFSPVAAGSVLTLNSDPGEGHSLIKVHSADDPGGIDLRVTSAVVMDFITSVPADFAPDGIQVLAKAHYVEGQPTTAQIISRRKTTVGVNVAVSAPGPVAFDLSTIVQDDPIIPGSVTIQVDVFGFGLQSIVDNGSGVLTPHPIALPLGGTVDYETGRFTGITAPLTAATAILLTITRGSGRDEVLICRVTGAPGAIVVNAATPTDREVPLALPGVDYGFMVNGSVEALAAAVEILNEVIAARTDLQSVAHPNLKTRLDTDLGAEAMALRLGHVLRLLRGNDYAAAASASEINVSGSFAKLSRSHLPAITMNGGASESVVGAITEPTDATRNICIVLEAATNSRLMESSTTRTIIFGRLRQEPDFILDGVLSFNNALTTVNGDAQAQFQSQVQVGDIVQAPDGNFYLVQAVNSNSVLTLATAYQGGDASSGGLIRRRFKLKLRKMVSGVEQAHTLPAATNIRFVFPAFITVAQANYDGMLLFHTPGERVPVPDATTAVSGKVAIADPSSDRAGAINLQVGGVPVAGSPFHTLNFTGAPGQILENSPGVIDVTNLGPVGPTGPGAGPGPPGLTGPVGKNLTQRTLFNKSNEKTLGPGPGPVVVSHSVAFGYNVTFLSGGIALHRDSVQFFASADEVEVTDIRLDTAQSGTIEATSGAHPIIDSFCKLYLDACGTT